MIVDEPLLRVRRPLPFYRRRGFRRVVLPVALGALAGLAVLVPNRALTLGVQTLDVVEGNVGSKRVLFDDPEIQDRLLRRHLRVHVTNKGSRAGVTSDLGGIDFVYPSGQPAEEMIKGRPGAREHFQLFTSPIVIGTYREYVPALEKAGLITTQRLAQDDDPAAFHDSGPPIFYRLDFDRMVDVMQQKTRWSDLDPRLKHNEILAQTSDICDSNHAETYLALLAFAENRDRANPNDKGRVVRRREEVQDVARRIGPLVRDRGMAAKAPQELYFVDEGKQWPLIVLYEHQFLSYQVDAMRTSGQLDRDRVLLYPDPGSLTQPVMVSLTDKGHRLGDVVDTDTQIHKRALALGFRVVADGGVYGSKELSKYLGDNQVPMPLLDQNATTAQLPDPTLLELMIDQVLDGIRTCPKGP
ncbi:hypothetical protein [Actinocrispum wychmicini]|uniref:Uncharacterized protein n=1 Tax=Actinocrispum wychmicini TaxID=1213861 RepID=A0A4R2K5S9_9PSEU|nr:hypothetical protein [Actinocrispum wychmicini]TCO65158.1 hypothetical protein EV192_101946 [Actinocrispum wychmicini]